MWDTAVEWPDSCTSSASRRVLGAASGQPRGSWPSHLRHRPKRSTVRQCRERSGPRRSRYASACHRRLLVIPGADDHRIRDHHGNHRRPASFRAQAHRRGGLPGGGGDGRQGTLRPRRGSRPEAPRRDAIEAAVGTTELGAQTPPTADTHFRIASNTKTFTAALIVLLAQDGKLKFSDPVSNYVPDVPDGANITIAELLKMRSGLYNYTAAPELADSLDDDPAKAWTPQEVLGHRVQAPAELRAGYLLRVRQHQLRTAGSCRREGRRKPVGPTVPGAVVRSGRASSRRRCPAIDDTSIPAPYSHGYMYGDTIYALADDRVSG